MNLKEIKEKMEAKLAEIKKVEEQYKQILGIAEQTKQKGIELVGQYKFLDELAKEQEDAKEKK